MVKYLQPLMIGITQKLTGQMNYLVALPRSSSLYYNPVNNALCYNYNVSNSNIGVKDGCLKCYTFASDSNTPDVTLILDHDIVEEAPMGEWLGNGSYKVTLQETLEVNTENWIYTPSIPSDDLPFSVGNSQDLTPYPWLYQNTVHGYWTSTYDWMDDYYLGWGVEPSGQLSYTFMSGDEAGIRPVITLPKYIIQ